MAEALFVTSLHREHLLHSWSVTCDGERAAFAECIALRPNGHLVVSDLLNKKVKEFDKTGQLVHCIGAANGPSLRSPRGLAALSGNRTAVADPQTNSIKIFDNTGKLVSKIKGPHIDLPCDLMVGPKKELYIVTDEGHMLLRQKSETATEPQTTNPDINMRRPGCMARTANGKIIICDEDASCMQILNEQTLDLEQTITLSGNDLLDAGNKCTPAGACIDDYGFLYVADTNNNRIIVFDEDMEVRAILHTTDWFREIRMRRDVEEMRLTLSGPVGVVVNMDGELCVLEQAGRVKVFKHFIQAPDVKMKKVPHQSSCCAIM